MKILKTILLVTAVTAIALATPAAKAQFRGAGPGTTDLLRGTPLIVTTGAISNITVYGIATQNGFSLSPYFDLTNSGTPSIAFYQTPVVPTASGTGTTVGGAVLVGTVAGNGTTAVRGNLLVLTNQNTVGVQISVSNTHSASIVVSNLYFISQ